MGYTYILRVKKELILSNERKLQIRSRNVPREKRRRGHRRNVILAGANYRRNDYQIFAGSVIMYYVGTMLGLLQPRGLISCDCIS